MHLEHGEDGLNDGMVRNERLRFELAELQFVLALCVLAHCGHVETP